MFKKQILKHYVQEEREKERHVKPEQLYVQKDTARRMVSQQVTLDWKCLTCLTI